MSFPDLTDCLLDRYFVLFSVPNIYAAALADAEFVAEARTHTGNNWSDMSSPIDQWALWECRFRFWMDFQPILFS
ncbi:MAG: hypothetical protein KTR32_00050 [Granulosicoccus sp.]|nr:hypothetical protein [Granulosicoccus sp.]